MSHLICLDKSPQEVDPFTLTLSELEIEITTLYGHINAATYRFLVLLEAFNAQDGWGEWGIKSCAHWLNWKCGIALGAAREKVRVAEALPTLPLTSAAFRSGTVSYSKVRAMTRIATPENEDYLVMIAQHGTASHVEKLVREFRRSEAWEAERHGAELRHQARMLEHYHDEDGMFVLHAKLPPEQGAVVLKAIQAAIASIAEEVREQKKLQDEREEAAQEAARAAEEAERAEQLQAEQAEQTENQPQAEYSHWNEQAPAYFFFDPELSTEDDRVAPGDCSPGAPTEPDVRNSRIRFLGLGIRCDTINTVNDVRRGQWIVFEQTTEARPGHARMPRAPVEPLAPHPFDLPAISRQGASIAGDAEVSVMPVQLATQCRMLFSYRSVPVKPTPLRHAFERTPETPLGGLALDHPPALPGPCPEVCECEVVEPPALTGTTAPGSLATARMAKVHQACLVRMQFQPEARKTLRQHLHHPPRIRFPLKAQHRIIGKPNHKRSTRHPRLHLVLKPGVQHLVQVDVGE